MGYGQFEDINKAPKDLLSKGYVFDRKVKSKHTTANGVTFETSHSISKDKLVGNVSAKFKVNKNLKVDKIDFSTGGNLKVKMTYANLLVDGLDFTVDAKTGALSAGGKDSAVLSAAYSSDQFDANIDLDAVKQNGAVSACTGYEGFVVGGKVNYDAKKAGSAAFALGAGYRGGDFLATVMATNKLSKFDAHVHQKCSSRLSAAIHVSADRSGAAPALTVGGKWKVDSSAALQAKVGTDGVVSMSYIQKLTNNVELTASSQIDGKNLTSKAVGCQLSFC